ncbi:uncharacterized protein EURHEDRAFT_199984 [Aspergillus ruber CBS 135680]|uniref:Uncharacterized protein n=1 Tax=Aspergillus ruber (strain CBS 135680) TaxID=1388766 RepID=A0A017S5W7_ASPRC|nr:uncharacterized protein EURHEDRAFT_199984 [Aspergillus ruber CBS 135680]EYE92241.1 hypothetical protein EURHEDRAFT_199984 [Aspergillus ruber CBS 135680]
MTVHNTPSDCDRDDEFWLVGKRRTSRTLVGSKGGGPRDLRMPNQYFHFWMRGDHSASTSINSIYRGSIDRIHLNRMNYKKNLINFRIKIDTTRSKIYRTRGVSSREFRTELLFSRQSLVNDSMLIFSRFRISIGPLDAVGSLGLFLSKLVVCWTRLRTHVR